MKMNIDIAHRYKVNRIEMKDTVDYKGYEGYCKFHNFFKFTI